MALVVQSRDVAVLDLVFKTKAIEFTAKMNVKNFKASDGWLDRCKKRFNVLFTTVSGENNACTGEMIAPREQSKLPIILSKYDLNQIYNADELGLFYRTQPIKSLHLKNENCVGGKHSKLHLTGLTAANAFWEKLSLFIIGKFKKPQYFKHIKHMPSCYRSQKKSWMDSMLFKEWVREVDKRFNQRSMKNCSIGWYLFSPPIHW